MVSGIQHIITDALVSVGNFFKHIQKETISREKVIAESTVGSDISRITRF